MLQGTNRLGSCDIITQVFHLQENWGLLQDTHTTHHSQIKYSRWLSNVSNRNNSATLRIAEFKFTHNFIICDQLPETELILGIDMRRKFSLSYTWDMEGNYYIQKEGKFLV